MTTPAAKIIARYLDGRVVKGHTNNFAPGEPTFRLQVVDHRDHAPAVIVRLEDLKAVFFLKDFAGEPRYADKSEFVGLAIGRKMRVRFFDGEELLGTSLTYTPNRDGFFLVPADPFGNNDRVFVLASAVATVLEA